MYIAYYHHLCKTCCFHPVADALSWWLEPQVDGMMTSPERYPLVNVYITMILWKIPIFDG